MALLMVNKSVLLSSYRCFINELVINQKYWVVENPFPGRHVFPLFGNNAVRNVGNLLINHHEFIKSSSLQL